MAGLALLAKGTEAKQTQTKNENNEAAAALKVMMAGMLAVMVGGFIAGRLSARSCERAPGTAEKTTQTEWDSHAAWEELTVEALRVRLRRRGATVGGSKRELIARLEQG
ncbi:MAG: SAP domain-containing protein [Ketobacter sp.]|nr:SAP domain-containing protein [Ketobacter sp.]